MLQQRHKNKQPRLTDPGQHQQSAAIRHGLWARKLHGGGLLLLLGLLLGGGLRALVGGSERNRAKSEREAEGGNHELFHF